MTSEGTRDKEKREDMWAGHVHLSRRQGGASTAGEQRWEECAVYKGGKLWRQPLCAAASLYCEQVHVTSAVTIPCTACVEVLTSVYVWVFQSLCGRVTTVTNQCKAPWVSTPARMYSERNKLPIGDHKCCPPSPVCCIHLCSGLYGVWRRMQHLCHALGAYTECPQSEV